MGHGRPFLNAPAGAAPRPLLRFVRIARREILVEDALAHAMMKRADLDRAPGVVVEDLARDEREPAYRLARAGRGRELVMTVVDHGDAAPPSALSALGAVLPS